jgi:metallo-beta-lactamase class B
MRQKITRLSKQLLVLSCFFAISAWARDHTGQVNIKNTSQPARAPLIQNSYDSPDSWRQPVTPFQIADRSWYIGTAGLSAILIKTDAGAILIDGGLPEAANILLTQMRQLGLSPHDLKWILLSHAHFDHAGPLAAIQRTTGARIATNAESAVLLARGGKADIHFGNNYPYQAVQTDRFLMNGVTVDLGGISLTAHFTPGHTPGGLSWTWTDQRAGKQIRIAYVDSLSAPGYKLKDNPRYPHILDDLRRSIEVVRALPCDLLLTPHPEASGWTADDTAAPWRQPMTCTQYAAQARQRLEAQLQKELRTSSRPQP